MYVCLPIDTINMQLLASWQVRKTPSKRFFTVELKIEFSVVKRASVVYDVGVVKCQLRTLYYRAEQKMAAGLRIVTQYNITGLIVFA